MRSHFRLRRVGGVFCGKGEVGGGDGGCGGGRGQAILITHESVVVSPCRTANR